MSNNPGPDLPRRKLLALLGGGSLAGLAGCQGDGGGSGDVTPTEGSDGRDDEGVTPTATSTVTATPVDADPEIVVPSDSLLEYEDGSAVPVGSELVIDCRGIDEELDAILDVENPSREELNGGCGDSFVFDEEGLYLMQLQAADGNTIVGRTETQLEALTVPEVSVSQIPGEMKEGEGYVVAYDSSNANLTHTVEMPEGWTEEYTGDQFQITPSEPGKTNITTETNAEIGNQRITRTIPIQPDSEISQEDNLEKRIEAAESFPKMERGGAYSVYDVEALRKLLDDPELKQIIHPELEYIASGNLGDGSFTNRSFENIPPTNPGNDLDWFWKKSYDAGDYTGEDYRGHEIWESGNGFFYHLIDRDNNYVISSAFGENDVKTGHDHVVNDFNGSFKDGSRWVNPMRNQDDIVLGEAVGQFLFPYLKTRLGMYEKAVLDEEDNTVQRSSHAYHPDQGGEKKLEEEQKTLEDVVTAYDENTF